ncbi:MAG: integrase core domain-containing protein [Elusimicrobia bacterium]|jgi:transposase InsO family protein|nr:integrase core domain-containing protein [Elusimicrobiota bacterium]
MNRKNVKSKYDKWREKAQKWKLSANARLRLEWIIFYHTQGNKNAAGTCRHFGMSRKTFYKWYNRFNEANEHLEELEDQSREPYNKRKWEVSLKQEIRIKELRREHMHYGKKKLKVLYEKKYSEEISTWKIERVVRKHKLYPDQIKAEKIARKRARGRKSQKKRITQLKKEEQLWFLLQLDTIVIYWDKFKRYIITAVDHASKLGYARMYKRKSSRAAKDFLHRLQYLIGVSIQNLQTDNGSEFTYYFDKTSKEFGINRYFSRVKTPKDNPEIERFNQTLEYEWLNDGNFELNCNNFNKRLTKWLVEYNFNRPHQTLDYLTPMEYIEKEHNEKSKVLPMYPASTLN